MQRAIKCEVNVPSDHVIKLPADVPVGLRSANDSVARDPPGAPSTHADLSRAVPSVTTRS